MVKLKKATSVSTRVFFSQFMALHCVLILAISAKCFQTGTTDLATILLVSTEASSSHATASDTH